MPELLYTKHALDVLHERQIPPEWVERVVASPALVEHEEDGTVHCIAPIVEQGNRLLRVVLAGEPEPYRVVTVFFDRRLRRKGL